MSETRSKFVLLKLRDKSVWNEQEVQWLIDKARELADSAVPFSVAADGLGEVLLRKILDAGIRVSPSHWVPASKSGLISASGRGQWSVGGLTEYEPLQMPLAEEVKKIGRQYERDRERSAVGD